MALEGLPGYSVAAVGGDRFSKATTRRPAALQGIYECVTGRVLYIDHLNEQEAPPDGERPPEPGV
jgi:hypothetical protein